MTSSIQEPTGGPVVADAGDRASWGEIWEIYKRFWAFVRPYRRKFFLALGMVLLAVPLAQLALFLTRDVTNQALLATNLTVDERWGTVIAIVSLQAVFFLASAILSTWREVFEWYLGMRSTFDLRLAFYRHLHRLPLSFLTRRTPGEHLYRSTTDMVSMFRSTSEGVPAVVSSTDAFSMFRYNAAGVALAIYSNDVDPYDPGIMGMIVRTGPLLLETVYTLAWTVALLSILDPWLGLFLVVYIVPFTVVSHHLYSRVRKTAFWFKERSEYEAGVLRDSIAGLRTLKVLGRLKLQERKFYGTAAITRKVGVKQAGELVLTQNGAQSGLKWVFGTLMFVYVSSQVMRGQMTVGDWVATFILLAAAQLPLEKFVQLSQLIRMQAVPAKRVKETLDIESTLDDKPGAPAIPPISGRVVFDGVTFSYSRDVPVLKGINLETKAGEYVGIVGPSGAGKSSLVNLMLRLYPVDGGSVTVDGFDVRDIQLQSLLDQVGVVPQQTFLYTGSIRDNILFGNPKATDEAVERAVDLAGLRPFVNRLADGLETEVGEGATISGGERQRIGIARAMVRDPKIMILDEATASLDPETEELVLQTIDGLRGSMTILAIAHRLKAVVPCDRIVALEAGEIAEVGSHQELLAAGGVYATLWNEQMRDWSPGVPMEDGL